MTLSTLDWGIIILFFALTLVIGIVVSRKAGTSTTEFFLSGRNMPWWLLGISMVATTFSADTLEERAKHGITEGLVRISAGLEAVVDIIADLEQALAE